MPFPALSFKWFLRRVYECSRSLGVFVTFTLGVRDSSTFADGAPLEVQLEEAHLVRLVHYYELVFFFFVEGVVL